MQIAEIIHFLEMLAPPFLQESYDNAGLITGDGSWECTGAFVCLDATEDVILEAKAKGYNLVIAHHPIIFTGLKKITGKTYVERAVLTSIKLDIAVYAIHTNLDNILEGVNGKMAEKIGLADCRILLPKKAIFKKLYTFVPVSFAERVRLALFQAGAGHIGNYSECSFNSSGTGTFKGGQGTNPFVGKAGLRHEEEEIKIELIFPAWVESALISALTEAHPYEVAAYDIVSLDNQFPSVGAGIIGHLPQAVSETVFFQHLQNQFGLELIRHTPFLQKPVQKVALCGGAGSFLTKFAIAAGADVFVTGDVKYHEFFDAEQRILLADIGHWESEQYTIELLAEQLSRKFPTFAVQKTGVKTNPVEYFW